jgi:prevent-host-death family protein
MKEIGAFDAKNKLAHLLDMAEQGEEIIITRHGKQVARLLPIAKPFDREAARQAVEEIKKMRKGMRLDDATIKELINEGRP